MLSVHLVWNPSYKGGPRDYFNCRPYPSTWEGCKKNVQCAVHRACFYVELYTRYKLHSDNVHTAKEKIICRYKSVNECV